MVLGGHMLLNSSLEAGKSTSTNLQLLPSEEAEAAEEAGKVVHPVSETGLNKERSKGLHLTRLSMCL